MMIGAVADNATCRGFLRLALASFLQRAIDGARVQTGSIRTSPSLAPVTEPIRSIVGRAQWLAECVFSIVWILLVKCLGR
jgi:hypothetical protein